MVARRSRPTPTVAAKESEAVRRWREQEAAHTTALKRIEDAAESLADHDSKDRIQAAMPPKSFAMTRYKSAYGTRASVIEHHLELWHYVRQFLQKYFVRFHGQTEADSVRLSIAFVKQLEEDCVAHTAALLDEMRNEIDIITVRLWTSMEEEALTGREFCSFINEATRTDDPATIEEVTKIARSIN